LRNDSIAVRMIEVFFEQSAVFLATGVALPEQFLTAELVPLLLGAIRANLDGEPVARFFGGAPRALG
jgi:hypothetical protein